MKKPLHRRSRKGFTLIELMVAMAIALIIMGMLIGITNVAMGTWQRGRAEVRASRQAKTMLDAMAKDLESMVVRSGNKFEWLYAAVEPTMPGTATDKSTNAAEFIFFSAATDRYRGGAGTVADLGGDVCAVSYKLAYQDPLMGTSTNPSDSTFVFYRQLMDPKPTFDTMLGKLDLRTAFAGTPGNNRFETQANAGTNVVNDSRYSFVCENVYQYSITFRVDVTTTVGTTTTTKPVRVTLGNSSSAKFLRVYGNRLDTDAAVTGGTMTATNAELKTGRVTGVEVSITVLSDSGLAQLKTRTFADDAAKAKFLAQNTFEFSKSVDVPGL
jgi:prepilin-type N-terminal cleavage/methylation domain-containing protein